MDGMQAFKSEFAKSSVACGLLDSLGHSEQFVEPLFFLANVTSVLEFDS